MKKCLPLRGIVTVLNTPFTASNELDAGALRRHVAIALSAGVAGFLVPAMASEVEKLSSAERTLFVDTVLDEVDGRATVIGGASAATSSERVRTARRLVAAGCDGVLVSIPYENEDQYARDVQQVADVAPPFLMLQDWDPKGYGVPVETLVRLFEMVEPLRAVKVEVVMAGRKYSELLAATDGRLHVSGGWAVMQMIEALDRGVHAIMPTALHEFYVRIYQLYTSGQRDAARKLFQRILPVLAFSNQHLDISIHFFKRLLHAQGVYLTAAVRQPIEPFDTTHERTADELIDLIRKLEKSLRGS
jgi:dihydrodipicolinate synthase/N-acetylneuraminate lyase